MSSFEDVPRNVCRVVTSDGTFRGTAFFVLPDGFALTCHHVVFGLGEILVQLPDETEPRVAKYDSDRSNPDADIAALRVSGAPPAALQLARSRTAQLAYGYGFRPTALGVEPRGHSFAGRLSQGQPLKLEPSADAHELLRRFPERVNLPWNQLRSEYRTGPVLNFDLVQGVQQGISGGPVYDPELRRVTGIFRAVEGDRLAYVLPLESVFDHTWRELEEENERAVHDSTLDRLAALDVGLVAAGASPVRPLVEYHLEEVFRDYAMFGGRERELQALVDFVQSDQGGYFFVTGPPLGYGKTALLVALTRALANHAPKPVVHFLNRNYSDWLDRDSCLENLCLQLMKIHGLGGRIPNKEHRLRLLYSELLKMTPAPGKRVVVILDGLDETIGLWETDSSLFPDVPPTVKVIFSAQSVADRDWLSHFKLRLPRNRIEPIERLTPSDVSGILARSGIATPDPAAAAARLFQLSGGDAFYLIELLRDLEEVGGEPERLTAGSTASEYLRTWWDGIGEATRAFYDLIGTLAVAVAPLREDALVDISRHDDLRGEDIGRVLRSAARYVSGSHSDGYQLRHARIRRFVVEKMRDRITGYQDALADFCLNWHEAGRSEASIRYALENGVRQLIDMKRVSRVQQQLSAEFIAAKWDRLRSFRGYIKDLSFAASALYREDRANIPQVLGLLVTRQTVRDSLSNLPAEVFSAWIRLGDLPRALTTGEDLSEARGLPSQHLILMAKELLKTKPDTAPMTRASEESKAERPEIATQLLERALGFIPMVRLPFMRFERFDQLVQVSATSPGATPQQRALVAEQAIRWGESIADPLERAFVLGLASYLAALGGDRASAEKALEEAEHASKRIALPADRLLVGVYRLQAIHALFPDQITARFQSFDTATDGEAMTFPLAQASAVGVIAKRLVDVDPSGRPLLRELAKRVAADIAKRWYDAQHVVNALLRVGAVDEAVALIDTAHDRSEQALGSILDGIDHLERLSHLDDRAWWPEARRRAEPRVLAAAGDWNTALERLKGIHPEKRSNSLKNLLSAIDTDPRIDVVAPEVWESLTRLIQEVPDSQRPDCLAAAALAASGNVQRARSFLDQAIHQVLARSTEGGTEQLQALHAVALHQEGRHAEAADAASRIEPPTFAAETFSALADYTEAGQTEVCARYAHGLLNCLVRAADPKQAADPRMADTIERVHGTALGFVRSHQDAGKLLYEWIRHRPITSGSAAIDLAVTGCILDPVSGWQSCTRLVEQIAKANPHQQPGLLSTLLTQLGHLPVVPAEGAAALLNAIDRVMPSHIPDSHKVRLATSRAALVVHYAPDDAIAVLRRALEILSRPWQREDVELAALRFVITSGLYTHGPASHKLDEASDLVRVWEAALLALDERSQDALAVLGDVLDFVRRLDSPADETTALSRLFASAGVLDAVRRQLIAPLLDQAIEQAASISRDDYQIFALHSAVRSFVVAGDFARAERTESLIRSTEPSQRMNWFVAVARERTEPLSPVERHVIKLLPRENHAFYSAYYAPVESERWPFVNQIMEQWLQESLFDKAFTRRGLLSILLSFACSLYKVGGANVIGPIIDTIRDYDGRLEKAGAILSTHPLPEVAT